MSEEKQTRKERVKSPSIIDTLEKRVETLEACLAKVCHMSGTERILLEYGIERWVPEQNDMRKFKD